MRFCSVDGCGKKHHSGGYCSLHYSRMKYRGEINPESRNRFSNRKYFYCTVEGCAEVHYCRAMCKKHYDRFMKWGDPKRSIREYHGSFGTAMYRKWTSMIQRCHNPKSVNFKRYGGRGISVCDEWRKSFRAFSEYMGDYRKGMHIDRVNNDGNYEPGNVRWATPRENMMNRNATKIKLEDIEIIKDMKKQGFSGFEIAKKYGVTRARIYAIWG